MSQKIGTDNFDELIESGKLIVVDFYAEWCAPCNTLAPIIEELSDDYESRAVIAKLNIEVDGEIADRYGVRNIPTIIFFKNGEVVDKSVGSASKVKIEDMINNHI